MHAFNKIPYVNKDLFYNELGLELSGLYEKYWLTNLANTAAALNAHLPNINWVGFYLWQEGELRLGPFQGLPACLRIPLGRGVCGTAAQKRQTVIVDDVDQFPGHIACDSRSKSEIVIPVVIQNRLLGVLDVDSPQTNRFDTADAQGLEKLVQELLQLTTWPASF